MGRTRNTEIAGAMASALLLAGCNSPAYFEGFMPLVLDQATITEAQEAEEGDGAGHPAIGAFVQQEYWLDYREPTPQELLELQPEGAEPAEVIPWVERDDLDISVQWRLTNDTEQFITAYVLLDGATEFFDYNPIEMYGDLGGEDADEIPFPSLLGYYPRHLGPGEVVRGEFREDDLREAMFDLDVLSRFCGGPLAVVHNHSSVDPAGTSAVPPDAVIAGMVMLRLTVGATAPVTLDYSIRIRDEGEVLFDRRTDERRFEPMPEPVAIAMAPTADDPTAGMSAYCIAATGGGT